MERYKFVWQIFYNILVSVDLAKIVTRLEWEWRNTLITIEHSAIGVKCECGQCRRLEVGTRLLGTMMSSTYYDYFYTEWNWFCKSCEYGGGVWITFDARLPKVTEYRVDVIVIVNFTSSLVERMHQLRYFRWRWPLLEHAARRCWCTLLG